jgi:hypothetical protein
MEGSMKRRFLSVILAAIIFASGVSARAAEETKKETIFTVTPRTWFMFGNLVDDEWFDSDPISMPLYGLSISVSPSQTPNWSFLINGYQGTADGNLIMTSPNQPHYPGTAHYQRTDIELLIRHTFPGTGLGLFSGPRYLNWRQRQSIPGVYNTVNDVNSDIWVPEIGVSYLSEIGESGRHRFFGNFGVGIAFNSWQSVYSLKVPILVTVKSSGSDKQPCIDVNIGYEYFFMKSGSAYLRYRQYALREGAGPGVNFNGPEIGLSFRF